MFVERCAGVCFEVGLNGVKCVFFLVFLLGSAEVVLVHRESRLKKNVVSTTFML